MINQSLTIKKDSPKHGQEEDSNNKENSELCTKSKSKKNK